MAQPAVVQVQEYASGLTRPTDIASVHDGRLYVAEVGGKIRIISPGGLLLPLPLLDISHKLSDTEWNGIFGLAFHPNYASNGYFFVKYIGKDGSLVVSRFQRDATNPDFSNPASEQIIITVPYQGGHRAGDIAFGADGYLYIPTGDGEPGGRGEVGDPTGVAQNLQSLKGKILRVNVDQGTPYSIPPTNPYISNGDNIPDEIWALGLRNPWRISFDKQTGDLWLGENGQDGWEEIDFTPAGTAGGVNYGWSCYEGTHPYNNCPASSSFTNPIYEYPGFNNNGNKSASVIGGYVYRGQRYPTLYGRYLFTDNASGRIGSIYRNLDQTTTVTDHGVQLTNPVAFGEDQAGELYVATFFEGKIYRIKTNEIESIQSGNWSTPSTWSCHCLPSGTEKAIISPGHTVTIQDQSPQVRGLHIVGQIEFHNVGVLHLTD
ncbi:PQQ-dependent sugar dehydrogenase [Telluribacter sp. SYSU D00476]|uniref:PQQ-dependent sugar dehydrogenase n=1 Tax=Telluribacter sp. SYSU D00476 TaxID=2811430 RepID=UPI001FF1BF8D|nr:PQQ-dependent sugar dehydrogenase [Telluribacter sp. SYSU D00476]